MDHMDIHEIHEQLGQLNGQVASNTNAINKLEDILERVRDRVPPWIVLVLTGMSGLLGSLLTVILSAKH